MSGACTVQGCTRQRRFDGGIGMCSMHAERKRLHGDPGKPTDRYVRVTVAERIRASLVPTDNGCIECTIGSATRGGHRMVQGTDGYLMAHRAIWAEAHGPIPEGLMIRHACDNPPCVNLDHLLIGTHADNTRDAVERGRFNPYRGSAHPLAKLTEPQVVEILRRVNAGERKKDVAEAFDISAGVVSKICRGCAWRHVHAEWCRQQILEHLADERDEARERGAAL